MYSSSEACLFLQSIASVRISKLISAAFCRCSLTIAVTSAAVLSFRSRTPNIQYFVPICWGMLIFPLLPGKLKSFSKSGLSSANTKKLWCAPVHNKHRNWESMTQKILLRYSWRCNHMEVLHQWTSAKGGTHVLCRCGELQLIVHISGMNVTSCVYSLVPREFAVWISTEDCM